MSNEAFLNLHNLVVDNIKSVSVVDCSTNEKIIELNTEERIGVTDSFGNVIKSFYKTKQSNDKIKQLPTNAKICTQCGAQLVGLKCEYCGTEFRY